jgi:putative membrane protein
MNSSSSVPGKFEPKSSVRWLSLGLKAELELFRNPLLVLSTLAIVLVPSLYAVFYISSFWDPYSHLDRLPAALVNADRGVDRGGRSVNLGDTVVKTFEQKPPFRFIRLPSPQAANDAIRRGEVYFTLVIPADFSERALAARQDEPANLTMQVAEGANYTSAIISKRFGGELAHTLNERLNRERWAALAGDPAAPAAAAVLPAIAQLRDAGWKINKGARAMQAGSLQLDSGLVQASTGARQLTDGTGQFADAAVALSNGMGRIASGVQEMRDRLPPANKLQELADGSKSAVDGAEKLVSGLDQLVAGGQRLEQGAGQLRKGADEVPFAGRRLSDGAGQLEVGLTKLNIGITQAVVGSRELHAGLERLDNGVQPLASGLVQLEQGLQTMLDQLPSTEQRSRVTAAAGQLRDGGAELTTGLAHLRTGSHELAEGSKKLSAGTAEMAAGLERLNAGFSSGFRSADAGGLAASVHVNIESTAPVPNNGTAFSPYFAPLSLWVGGIMMTFVFHFRRVIEPMRGAPSWVRWLAKAAVPLCLGVLQATVVVAVLRLGFGMAFAHPWLVWLAASLGSLTFVAVILLLIMVLADAGRLLAVVLLILQLAAAGGIYPVELSGRFYEAIHPFLPFTALVNAFRATMFEAYGGAWLTAAFQLAATGCGAAVLAMWLARWKYVSRESYGPAVEFP